MRAATALAALLVLAPVGAHAQQWTAGVHYDVVEVPYEAPEDGSIEVVELFWYGCGACFQFEPFIERWLESKPDDVRFVRIAASSAAGWRTHARAFYTFEALDIVERVHTRVFRALHVERAQLNDVDSIARFAAQHGGVDADAFRRAWDSFGVEARMRRGDQFARRYQLSSTPAIVVAGKYRTNPSRVGSYEGTIALIDHLVELERGGPAPEGRAERPPHTPEPAQAAPGNPESAEPVTGERGAVLWWLWGLVGVVVLVIVIVVVSRRR